MEIFQIDENLYQSSRIDDPKKVKQFDICIDLLGEVDDAEECFKIFLRWPIVDGPFLPDVGILKTLAAFAYDLAYNKKINVLVHCNEGKNRASLVNGEILHLKGMKGQAIVDYIRSKRPGALNNLYFEEYLRNLK